MRAVIGLSIALLVVLAGCNAPFASPDGGVETTSVDGGNGGATTSDSGSPGTTAGASTDEPQATAVPPDPATDRLGWENGYWYNESLAVDGSDGLNETEREAVVARTMARLESIRQLEFQEAVSVEVISRTEYRERARSDEVPQSFRTFDNAKFEAMVLVGEDRDALDVQDRNRGQSVQGYYSPANDSIVIVSNSETSQTNASTLAHELVHALQDQHFGLESTVATRDAYNARNGVVEGEANFVQQRYEERFDDEWDHSGQGSQQRAGSDIHYGIYFLEFFPYSDGPGFVADVHARQGWDGVNALHEDYPRSAEQVIYPDRYGQDEPTNVTVPDRSSAAWTRVEPERDASGQSRPGYGVLGQSALTSMFAYTLFDDYNDSSVVRPQQVINYEGQDRVNSTDPLNYDIPATEGWDGDTLYAYRNDGGETAYVWKLVWDSPAEAREFAAAYQRLLVHWGGEQVSRSDGGSTTTWRVAEDSPFTDAFRVEIDGDTVTITNAPTTDDLDGVHGR